ncbi:MAG TPA: DUF5615 family PIN-like protein [Terriglobia bacterium]|nr:DUF5615 family PIN-like protein [Terriglobia bacterium]
MRVLIDACVDPRIVEAFLGHEVKTAAEMGWHQLKDNALVAKLKGHFDVLVTIDQGFEHQQNLKSLSFGLVIVHVPRNKVEFYRPLFGHLIRAAQRVKPGEVVDIRAPA